MKKKDTESKQLMNVGFKSIRDSFQIKEENGSEYGYYEGYGSTFDDIDHGKDMVVSGAFLKSINDDKTVQILWQHDRREVLGSYVKLKEDDKGLYVKGRLNLGVARAKEAYALLKAGDIDSMSIGYYLKAYEVVMNDNDSVDHWKLTEIDLCEISLVTTPMNDNATVTDVKGDAENQIKNSNKKENEMSVKKDEDVKEISGIEVAKMVAKHESEMEKMEKSHEKTLGERDDRIKELEGELSTKDNDLAAKDEEIKGLKSEVEESKKTEKEAELKKEFSAKYPNFTGDNLDEKFSAYLEVKNAGLDVALKTMENSLQIENDTKSSDNPIFKSKGSSKEPTGKAVSDEQFYKMVEQKMKEDDCSYEVALEAVGKQTGDIK